MKSAAIALVVGLAIYLFTRDGLVLPSLATLDAPDIVRYQLPDALWQYAFCICVYAIWHDPRWLLLPLALGLTAEVTIGTFDPLDVVALVTAALVAYLRALSETSRGVRSPRGSLGRCGESSAS